MRIVWGKQVYLVGGRGPETGYYYKVLHDKISRYCCLKMEMMLAEPLGGRALTLYEHERELAIESYDFDDIRPVKFCMFCGEGIELELLD